MVVLTDGSSDTILLTPEVMTGGRGVDRLKLVREFVRDGGGLLMCGGYASFGGFRNTGRYHGTAVEDVLPVFIKDGDDRVEIVDGFRFEVTDSVQPVVNRIDWKRGDFFMLGYNRFRAKPGAKVLAKYGRDPMLVVWEYHKGRSMAFACDCEPHWAGTFIAWPSCKKFLTQAIKWLARQE